MTKRILTVFLALMMCVALLAGCKSTSGTGDSKTDAGATTTAPAADTTAEAKPEESTAPATNNNTSDVPSNDNIVVTLASAYKTIDPALNSSVDGASYIQHMYEGLLRYADDGKTIEPGMAELPTISADGLVYTFKIRDGMKWSDGQPVTAKDFEYSWKRVADPKTAAEYSNMMTDYVKGALEFFQDKGNADGVMAKALDDSTFEVTLVAPCSYYTQICAFGALMPVRQDKVEGNAKWSESPDTYISNGMYKLKEIVSDVKLVVEKNPNYHEPARALPQQVTFLFTADSNAALALFRTGEILMSEDYPSEEFEALQAEGNIQTNPKLGIYYYCFNNTKAPFDNPKVREAFSLAVDREYIVKNITKAGQVPAGCIVPPGINDTTAGTDFREVGGDWYKQEEYPQYQEQAKKALADAGYPDGKGLPAVEVLYNESPAHKQIAEALSAMWEETLGVKVTLASQEWNVFQDTRTKGLHQIARDGWIGDFYNPLTFLDIFMSTNGNNNCKYKNEEFDKLCMQAKGELDPVKSADLLHQAEKILLDDHAALPIYYYTDPDIVNPKAKGIISTPLGYKLFYKTTYEN